MVRCPQVEETVRSAKGTSAEVLAFHWPWFDDDCDRKPGQPKMPSGGLPLPPALQATVISAAYSTGADGVVLWDCAKFMARGAGAGSKTWLSAPRSEATAAAPAVGATTRSHWASLGLAMGPPVRAASLWNSPSTRSRCRPRGSTRGPW